ncbi:MAG TPA: histidine--tRNA ligase [Candidatus Paceibacterota bacterium]|nr:histidine--tRNA ligase [Candidatus Paceibacterota bacterium]
MSKKEKLSTESYKGVRDFYPEDQAFLTYLLATMRGVVERYGYVEYHASVLEPAELYKSKGAENEEMVNEQTYTFLDRGGREVTLRPEMTPTVARMVAGKRRELGFPLRWYSIPNLFRYERPQRGRLREHWQLNIDIFGSKSLAADAEVMAVAHAIMTALGAKESDFVIKIGSRNFLDGVVRELGLDEEGGKKLRGLLDRRAKMPAGDFERDIADLGVAAEMLSDEKPPEDVALVLDMLRELGITNAVFDPSIVRGFDYYTGVVFEVFDTHPDNNRSVFGGGRYDGLTQLFDDEALPAVGCAAGDATLRDFLEVRGLLPSYLPTTKVYMAVAGPEFVPEAMKLADALRRENVAVAVDLGEKRLGDQIRTAAKHKVPYVLVVGEDELASGAFKVKDLASGEEKKLSREELASFFLSL